MRHTLVLTCYSISKTSYRLYRQHCLSWLQALCTHPETLLQVVPICVNFSVFFLCVCVWAIELQYYEELLVERVVIYVVMMVKRWNDWRLGTAKALLRFFLVFHQYVWCLHTCANASRYLVLLSKWRISTFCIPLAIHLCYIINAVTRKSKIWLMPTEVHMNEGIRRLLVWHIHHWSILN